jgi:hypothetical protein
VTSIARAGATLTPEQIAEMAERDAAWDGRNPLDRWETRESVIDAFMDRRALLAYIRARKAEDDRGA